MIEISSLCPSRRGLGFIEKYGHGRGPLILKKINFS
jgi:hypothetical protein